MGEHGEEWVRGGEVVVESVMWGIGGGNWFGARFFFSFFFLFSSFCSILLLI